MKTKLLGIVVVVAGLSLAACSKPMPPTAEEVTKLVNSEHPVYKGAVSDTVSNLKCVQIDTRFRCSFDLVYKSTPSGNESTYENGRGFFFKTVSGWAFSVS